MYITHVCMNNLFVFFIVSQLYLAGTLGVHFSFCLLLVHYTFLYTAQNEITDLSKKSEILEEQGALCMH